MVVTAKGRPENLGNLALPYHALNFGVMLFRELSHASPII
jgi:hypothetical protein